MLTKSSLPIDSIRISICFWSLLCILATPFYRIYLNYIIFLNFLQIIHKIKKITHTIFKQGGACEMEKKNNKNNRNNENNNNENQNNRNNNNCK